MIMKMAFDNLVILKERGEDEISWEEGVKGYIYIYKYIYLLSC